MGVNKNGHVTAHDLRWDMAPGGAAGPEGVVPPEAIKGAWRVGEDGLPTGEFEPNPGSGGEAHPTAVVRQEPVLVSVGLCGGGHG